MNSGGLCAATQVHYQDALNDALPRDNLVTNPVVFVDDNGSILCRLRDDHWTVPQSAATWTWDISNDKENSPLAQARLLLFHVMYHPGLPDLAFSTLSHYYYGLRLLARTCDRLGYSSIGVFFSDDIAGRKILREIESGRGLITFLHIGASLFNASSRIGERILGFSVHHGSTYQRLRHLLRNLNAQSFQHPVIPWGIYKTLICSVIDHIDRSLAWLDDPAWVDCIRYHISRRQHTRSRDGLTARYVRAQHPRFAAEIPHYQALLGKLGSFSELARIGILLFTGCRRSEASKLAPDCLDNGKNPIYLIHGQTSKTLKGDTYWVTNRNGAKAVELALKVRQTIADGARADIGTLPLYPSLFCFPRRIAHGSSNDFSYTTSEYSQGKFNGALERIGISIPVITATDFKFLSELSTDSRVNLEKYCIGSPFRFSAHQLRRSFAYYTTRSGRVEIGALRRQFQHLSVAMTRYYASDTVYLDTPDGTSFADLVAKERLLEADERMSSHLNNSSKLSGAMGTSIRKNIERASEKDRPLIIEQTRKRMLKRVAQGEIDYRQTPLGACMSRAPCFSRLRGELSACLKCKDAVLEQPRVEHIYERLQGQDNPFFAAQAEHFSYFLLGKSKL